jgi:hypothetical protein
LRQKLLPDLTFGDRAFALQHVRHSAVLPYHLSQTHPEAARQKHRSATSAPQLSPSATSWCANPADDWAERNGHQPAEWLSSRNPTLTTTWNSATFAVADEAALVDHLDTNRGCVESSPTPW